MAKKDDKKIDNAATQPAADDPHAAVSRLKQMTRQAQEGDSSPGTHRFRDILSGEFLWTLMRTQAGLILLIVAITVAYVATRYQCQQDAIEISQLEKKLEDARLESLSSSSDLTQASLSSSVLRELVEKDSTKLMPDSKPPFIIKVPEEKEK